MPPQASDTKDPLPSPPPDRRLPQHGVNGVYYGGNWLDMEDCANAYFPDKTKPTSGEQFASKCASCPNKKSCGGKGMKNFVRSKSAMDASKNGEGTEYDVVIVGAGCIGSAIARELSKYQLSVLLLEAADDVSQGATKGNSGIVHAGYDDKPNTNRAKFCWTGNQMFEALDKELRFGYQKNGSLVLATSPAEVEILHDLKKRGKTIQIVYCIFHSYSCHIQSNHHKSCLNVGDINGVKRLKILNKEELFAMEPAVNPNSIGALYSPDAGNAIPYEYAIALAENAVDNGVEIRIRREVLSIDKNADQSFSIKVRHWEPQNFMESKKKYDDGNKGLSTRQIFLQTSILLSTMITIAMGVYMVRDQKLNPDKREQAAMVTTALTASGFILLASLVTSFLSPGGNPGKAYGKLPFQKIVEKVSKPEGQGGTKVEVDDMFKGGSGSSRIVKGVTAGEETISAKYIINCAGGASDKIAKMIGDDSFYIKPRLGDYLLLNRNQGHLTSKTIFPCPDPVLGKGVLVQTTLWGNLILGPTARDMHTPEAKGMTNAEVQEYILSKCKNLVPYFDPRETFHAFCGARAKNSRGDWVIERSAKDGSFIHAAGIDSPGLAGSPAIALEIVKLLEEAGCIMKKDPTFNPNRAPIITPKKGFRGLKMGPIGKNDSTGIAMSADDEEKRMASNIICKCEKVTELEVVRALRRSLPIDSTQAIRKRTRAGMGHCQGDQGNYDCESRVKAIIARECAVAAEEGMYAVDIKLVA